jgi:DNA polymerase I
METICRHCGEDFTLPESQRTRAALRCPHCQALAVAGALYRRCAICGASYRPDNEACPYRDEHPPVSELPVEYYASLHQMYLNFVGANRRSPSERSNGNGDHANGKGKTVGANGGSPYQPGNGRAPRNGATPQSIAPTVYLTAEGRVPGSNAGSGGIYAYVPQFHVPTIVPVEIREQATVEYTVDDESADFDDPNTQLLADNNEGSDLGAEVVNPDDENVPEAASSIDWENPPYELINDPRRMAEVMALLLKEKALAVDTETSGLDPYSNELLLLQISTPEMGYIFDVGGGSGRKLDIDPLRQVLENPDILKLLQNAKFDYKFLKLQAGIELVNIYDTMLAERVLTSGISREISLKNLAYQYADLPMDKSERANFIGMKPGTPYGEELLKYAIRDVLILFLIYEQQKPKLKKLKLERTAKLEFDCIPPVGDMELAGCAINVEKWHRIIEDVKVLRDQAATELLAVLEPTVAQATMFGVSSINLNSNMQLIECFAKLGVNLPDTMESTLVKYDHPAIKMLLTYREHEKTLSAFGEKFLQLINPVTGRIHPDFSQHGADTGRFSCSNPNVQQIPASFDFRSCFVAAPGYKLITCDYSQAELRILAELSGDPAFIAAFTSGGDLHTLTASQMFQVPLERVDKSMRGKAKAINFGLAYGRGPGSLAITLGVDVDEAKRLIEQYFKAYSGIQRWLDAAARSALKKGYSETPIGRKRFFAKPDPASPTYNSDRAAIERQGKNAPIQGANADMTKTALIFLKRALKGFDARVVNTVHDEIVVEAREDQAEVVCNLVERAMIEAGEEILKKVPVKADPHIGDYWSK